MIVTLRVTCVPGFECLRVIEMDSGGSLLDLHEAIQDAVEFDRDHLFEFFVGRNYRNPKVVIASGVDIERRPSAYGRITLDKVFPLPEGLRLFYHFDFGDDWYFEIRKSRKRPSGPQPGVEYPRVVESRGANPEQYPDME
jgi:hypothetical protein